MYRLVFVVLVASVSAEVFIASRCPNPKAVDNFDFATFGQGVWYEVARYQNKAEKYGHCSFAEYVPQGDSFRIKNNHVASRKLAWVNGFGKLATGADSSGIMDYTLPYGPGKSLEPYRLNVLATDNRNFAIVYNCRYNEDKNIRQDLAWVLSRTKIMDPASKAYVENFMRESKFLDGHKFVWPDFSDAACYYEP